MTKQRVRGAEPPKMSSTRVGFILLGFIIVAVLGYLAGALQPSLTNGFRSLLGRDTQPLDTSSLQETYQKLKDNFDGDIDEAALINGANRGMVDALGDRYTVFMNQEETQEFNNSLSGNVGSGVGIEVALRGDQPTVVRVLRDNPAEKAGVQVGDSIVAVNGDSTIGATVTATTQKIRGDEGTSVKVTMLRNGSRIDFTMTRQQINNPSVYSSRRDDLGIITITRFDNDTGSLTRKAAQELKDAGVKGVVLDLRGNGGGYVNAAKAVASVWLKNALIVTEKASGRTVEEIRSSDNPILAGVPTVVLVNESSASASEIVAGALRDHNVAKIVGQTTFGKGSVQQLLNLSNGATLKVTIARWYTPSGRNISEEGITPDVKVEMSAGDSNAGRDPQLDTALQQLR